MEHMNNHSFKEWLGAAFPLWKNGQEVVKKVKIQEASVTVNPKAGKFKAGILFQEPTITIGLTKKFIVAVESRGNDFEVECDKDDVKWNGRALEMQLEDAHIRLGIR